mgnify:FL=1
MKNRYRTLFLICFVSAGALAATAGAQNFAGTVTAGNLEQPSAERQEATPEKSVSTDPLSPEPAAAAEDSTASVEVPEAIATMSHYAVGETDILEITVMRHPEVSGQFVINNEGNIQYEFVGDLNVLGLTKDQVKKLLTEKLSDYIIDPEITVKIVGYNSKIIYVVGEVGRPGKIYMEGDTMTVHEALVEAGLPLLSAKTNAGRLITPSNTGNPLIRKVNVEKLLYQGDLRENLVMQPGDTLYVPPTFLAKTMRVIQPVAQPIGTAAGAGRTVMTGF